VRWRVGAAIAAALAVWAGLIALTALAGGAAAAPAARAGPAVGHAGAPAAAPLPQAGVLGPRSVSLQVQSVVRIPGALRVRLQFANHGTETARLNEYTQYGRPDGLDSVTVVDPASRRRGDVLRQGADCRCDRFPIFLERGQATVLTADLADPGGQVIDVAVFGYHPVRGVPVQGAPAGTASGATLRTRSLNVEPRAEKTPGAEVSKKRIRLSATVLFATESYQLTPRARQVLQAAAEELKAQPGRRLGIFGHTDNRGSEEYGYTLSENRAAAVQRELAKLLGPGWTYETKGFGEDRPIAANNRPDGSPYPEGMARNRRVEIVVLG
jgi:outer membrane protein OmpA-like peptidoglycan-associated protein